MEYEDCSASGDELAQQPTGLAKKGTPWSIEEHYAFLRGLEKLGRGNWRGISRFFVPTRTPTQVASHAQKHFLRLTGNTKRRSRFSAIEDELYNKNTPSPSEAAPANPKSKASAQKAAPGGPSGPPPHVPSNNNLASLDSTQQASNTNLTSSKSGSPACQTSQAQPSTSQQPPVYKPGKTSSGVGSKRPSNTGNVTPRDGDAAPASKAALTPPYIPVYYPGSGMYGGASVGPGAGPGKTAEGTSGAGQAPMAWMPLAWPGMPFPMALPPGVSPMMPYGGIAEGQPAALTLTKPGKVARTSENVKSASSAANKQQPCDTEDLPEGVVEGIPCVLPQMMYPGAAYYGMPGGPYVGLPHTASGSVMPDGVVPCVSGVVMKPGQVFQGDDGAGSPASSESTSTAPAPAASAASHGHSSDTPHDVIDQDVHDDDDHDAAGADDHHLHYTFLAPSSSGRYARAGRRTVVHTSATDALLAVAAAAEAADERNEPLTAAAAEEIMSAARHFPCKPEPVYGHLTHKKAGVLPAHGIVMPMHMVGGYQAETMMMMWPGAPTGAAGRQPAIVPRQSSAFRTV